MKRLIIICEGQTEQEFCKGVLYPFFYKKNITISCPLIKKSNGGIVSWQDLKKQIYLHMKEKDSFVTTLIDFYGIKDYHKFPQWDKGKQITDKCKKMDFLETEMKYDIDDINENLKGRFIPYIQLHEFEALLFCNFEIFKNHNFTKDEFNPQNQKELQNIINQYSNPELINDGMETAPSKRLKKLIKGYNKIVHGASLAEATGLDTIRSKCPRFNKWIKKLEYI